MEAVFLFLSGLIEQYASVFPEWIVGAILLIGTLRILVKPLMSLFKAVTELTPSTSDDELYVKIETSKAYSVLVYVLDWIASLKLPKKAKK